MFYANHHIYIESQDTEDSSSLCVEVELECPEGQEDSGCEEFGQILYFPKIEKAVIKTIPDEFYDRRVEIEALVMDNLSRVNWERDHE